MYSERIVAFIDLLGSKSLIVDPKARFEDAFRIADAFNKAVLSADNDFHSMIQVLENKIDPQSHKVISLVGKRENILFFSDCVVWSYPIAEIKIQFELFLHGLIRLFAMVQYLLFLNGIVIRGGISRGPFYQDATKIFGPGLVKAYVLEQSTINPQIVIDQGVTKKAHSQLFKVLSRAYIQYDDKLQYYFVDIFRMLALKLEINISDDPKFEEVWLRAINRDVESFVRTINSGLQNDSRKVRLKYLWLYDQICSHRKLIPFLKEHKLRHLSVWERAELGMFSVWHRFAAR